MLLKKCAMALLLLVLLVGLTTIPAGAVNSKKPDTGGITVVSGYSVNPGNDASEPMSMLSAYTISQNQVQWHPKYIGPGCTGFYVDLNWGNPSNSLRLRVYKPDGTPLGPFYDYSDGRIDGRIYLRFSGNPDMPSGTYYSEVYGYHVSGNEDYTI